MNSRRSLRFRSLVLSSAMAALLLISAPPVRAQQRQALATAMAAPANVRFVGRLPAAQHLNVALTLSLRNQDQLLSLIDDLSDPTNPRYRQFLSVEEFTQQFGPTTADYQKVMDFARSYNLSIASSTPNRLVLDVSGAASDIERAFGVTMQVYQHPTESRTFYAPNVEPSVDPGVPVQGVNGLSNFHPPTPVSLKRTVVDLSVKTNTTGSGPGGQFLGSDMRAAYAPGVTQDGTGQALGLFEFGPYNLSDVTSYFSTIGQPLNVPIVNVLLDGVNGICGAGCDDGEEVIDIEQGISMAPHLSAVIVYEGNDDTDMLNRMASDNIAKQLSCSFGWLPADPASDEPIFLEFAAQGQSFFVASGDGGAYTPPTCTNNCNIIFYPADDPYITAAGGTDLITQGAGGAWLAEGGWIGSGGGYSTNGFAIPKYQVPVITSTNQGSTTLRNIPDLAAEANTDNYYCANGSCQGGVGGTSLAAPRWAGFVALANQRSNGNPIGFVNPTIYSLGQKSAYKLAFHDMTTGDNFNGESPNLFSAAAGFDLVSGWGSPAGQALINIFGPAGIGPNFTLTATPATLSLTQGNSGTSTVVLAPVKSFTGTVNLTATVLGGPAGVTATISPSSLSGSGSATLTVGTTGAAPGGNFPIVVTGTSGAISQTAYVTLALPGFTIAGPANTFVNQSGSTVSTITITPVNGFSRKVTLAVSGAPKGVKTTLTGSGDTFQLNLSASSLAATGFSSLTVTGTSGNLTQTTDINLAVSAAIGATGSGTEVDLSSAYNVTGIYTDGTVFSSSGGLDGGGSAYSSNLLTATRAAYGVGFTFGPANSPNAVTGTGQTIALPSGSFSKLVLLATGVQGSQEAQTLTVTYTDGTTSVFTQSFSDWFSPQNFSGEFEGVAMAYRDVSDGTEDNRTFNLYGYSFALNSAKVVKSLKLPNNQFVALLAATLEQ